MLCDSFIKRSPLCLFSLTVVEMFTSKTARMNPNGSTWGKSQEIDGSLPTSKDEGKLWLACGTRRKSKRYARISIWQVCLHSQVQQRKPAGTKTEKKTDSFCPVSWSVCLSFCQLPLWSLHLCRPLAAVLCFVACTADCPFRRHSRPENHLLQTVHSSCATEGRCQHSPGAPSSWA